MSDQIQNHSKINSFGIIGYIFDGMKSYQNINSMKHINLYNVSKILKIDKTSLVKDNIVTYQDISRDISREIYDEKEFNIKSTYYNRPISKEEIEMIDKELKKDIFSYPSDYWKKSRHKMYLDWEKKNKLKLLTYNYISPKIDNNTNTLASSLDEFNKNFTYFTEGCLEGLDWRNLIVAGGAVMTCLFSMETQITNFNKMSEVEREIERYCLLSSADKTKFDKVKNMEDFYKVKESNSHYKTNQFSSSDVDLYIIGLNDSDANKKILEINNILQKNCNCQILTTRTEYTVSFTPFNNKYRTIQVILRIYDSPIKVISYFDVDPCCCYYDGFKVYSNQRFIDSMISKIIWIHPKRQSPTYFSRLMKYHSKGFSLFCQNLKKENIDYNYLSRINKYLFTYNPTILKPLVAKKIKNNCLKININHYYKNKTILVKKNIEKRIEWINNIIENCMDEEFIINIPDLDNKNIKCTIIEYKDYKLSIQLSKEDYDSIENNIIELGTINLVNDLVGLIGKLHYEEHKKYLKKANIFHDYFYKKKINSYKESTQNSSNYEFFKIERFINNFKLIRESTEKNNENDRECHYIFTTEILNENSNIFKMEGDLVFKNSKDEIQSYKTRLNRNIQYIPQYSEDGSFTGQFRPAIYKDLFKGLYLK